MGEITDDVKYPPEDLAADQELLAERSGTTVKVRSNSIIDGINAAAAVGVAAQDTADAVGVELDDHEADVANPHTVTAEQVGLGSVDNTSDVDKPVSTAQQAALDGKAPLASPTFTGTVTVPAVTGVNQAARVTAYDAATGRLAIGGHEVGNTGWRAITTWDAAGVVSGEALNASWAPIVGDAGGIWVRRHMGSVDIYIQRLERLDSTDVNVWATFVLPVGFRPRWGHVETITLGATSVMGLAVRTDGRLQRGSGGKSGSNGIVADSTGQIISVPAAAATPVTLPGTAA